MGTRPDHSGCLVPAPSNAPSDGFETTPGDLTRRCFAARNPGRGCGQTDPGNHHRQRAASPTSATTASFTFHSTFSGATFTCRLDGSPFVTCASPTAFSGLA